MMLTACSEKSFVGNTYFGTLLGFPITASFSGETSEPEGHIHISELLSGNTYVMDYFQVARFNVDGVKLYFSDRILLEQEESCSWVSFQEYSELNDNDTFFLQFTALLYDTKNDEITFLSAIDFGNIYFDDWYEAYENGREFERPLMENVRRVTSKVLKRCEN